MYIYIHRLTKPLQVDPTYTCISVDIRSTSSSHTSLKAEPRELGLGVLIPQKVFARWFKVTFWFSSWRSLSPSKGHLTIPKRPQRIARWMFSAHWEKKTVLKKNKECNNCYTLPETNNPKKPLNIGFFCCPSLVSHPKNHPFFCGTWVASFCGTLIPSSVSRWFWQKCGEVRYPEDPWDWHIYLHEWLIFIVNVGKYTIHGSNMIQWGMILVKITCIILLTPSSVTWSNGFQQKSQTKNREKAVEYSCWGGWWFPYIFSLSPFKFRGSSQFITMVGNSPRVVGPLLNGPFHGLNMPVANHPPSGMILQVQGGPPIQFSKWSDMEPLCRK